MALYAFKPEIRNVIGQVMSMSQIKGAQAQAIVGIAKLIQDSGDKPVQLTDEQRDFLMSLVQNITIQGKDAALILQTMVALSKPIDEVKEPDLIPAKPLKVKPSAEAKKVIVENKTAE